MDERALRKLAAAAEHERQQADVLGQAIPAIEAKVDRARDEVEAALASLEEARADAAAAEERAVAAETAYQQAADGAPVPARAGLAAGAGGVN